MINVVFYPSMIWELVCVYVYVFIWLTNVPLPWRSRAGEVLSLRCTVLWRGLMQLSSCHMLQEHTHCHFPERVPTTHTNTPQPHEPHIFLPLVYLPLFACLGSVLIFLSVCSSDPLKAPSASRRYTPLCWPSGHPTPLRATLTMESKHAVSLKASTISACTAGLDALSPPELELVPSATADTGVSV